jgi:hypothetical protein
MDYASISDIRDYGRNLSASEEKRAQFLIESVSAELNLYAESVGKDLEELCNTNENVARVAKAVTVDTVVRVLNQEVESQALSQMSQSVGGYSVSGTFLVPGGGTLVLKRDLKRLGLRRQKYGLVDVYGELD